MLCLFSDWWDAAQVKQPLPLAIISWWLSSTWACARILVTNSTQATGVKSIRWLLNNGNISHDSGGIELQGHVLGQIWLLVTAYFSWMVSSCPHTTEGVKLLSETSFRKILIPPTRILPSGRSHIFLLGADLFSKTITFEVIGIGRIQVVSPLFPGSLLPQPVTLYLHCIFI